MKKQVSGARTSFSPVFLRIVKENHKKVLSLETRLKRLGAELKIMGGEDHIHGIEEKIQLLETELVKASLIVIVFSAMSLESYIYDYAARHLTDAFVKDHLDKLDTLSKWIIVPALITGREISRDQNWSESFKKLIKARNSIIHHKSSEPPALFLDMKKYLAKQRANSETLLEVARQSIDLLSILADKITELDPEETPWVKSYLA